MSKLIIALYVLATSFALLSIKLGSKDGPLAATVDGKLHINANAYAIAGIVLYGISFLIYTFLISKYDLGYIIPLVTALTYVIIFVGSFFVFNEAFGAVKIIGIVLILVGAGLLNFK